MARLRYAKSLEEVRRAHESNPEFLKSTVRSIRAVYETHPELVAAVIPKPLVPAQRPEVCVTFSHVAMHINPQLTIEIGSAIFGVRARYEGQEGIYLLTMPMTTEQAVLGGRDTYGEPKKIAKIDFAKDGARFSAKVERMGITYLEAQGSASEKLGPREYSEYAFCFKALPSCDKNHAFDGDPLLVRLEWKQHHDGAWRCHDGQLTLRESPFDPVADLPVRRLVRMDYDEGTTESNGRVLRSVPGEWLLPFIHQRYDEPGAQGVEIALSAGA